MPEKTVFEDLSLKAEILEKFGSIRIFADAAAIEYQTVQRVLSGQRVNLADVDQVIAQFDRLSPDAVDAWYKDLASEEKTDALHRLYDIVLDLYAALEKRR